MESKENNKPINEKKECDTQEDETESRTSTPVSTSSFEIIPDEARRDDIHILEPNMDIKEEGETKELDDNEIIGAVKKHVDTAKKVAIASQDNGPPPSEIKISPALNQSEPSTSILARKTRSNCMDVWKVPYRDLFRFVFDCGHPIILFSVAVTLIAALVHVNLVATTQNIQILNGVEDIQRNALACIGQQVQDLAKNNGSTKTSKIPLWCQRGSYYHRKIETAVSDRKINEILKKAQLALATDLDKESVLVGVMVRLVDAKFIVKQLEHLELLPRMLTEGGKTELVADECTTNQNAVKLLYDVNSILDNHIFTNSLEYVNTTPIPVSPGNKNKLFYVSTGDKVKTVLKQVKELQEMVASLQKTDSVKLDSEHASMNLKEALFKYNESLVLQGSDMQEFHALLREYVPDYKIYESGLQAGLYEISHCFALGFRGIYYCFNQVVAAIFSLDTWLSGLEYILFKRDFLCMLLFFLVWKQLRNFLMHEPLYNRNQMSLLPRLLLWV